MACHLHRGDKMKTPNRVVFVLLVVEKSPTISYKSLELVAEESGKERKFDLFWYYEAFVKYDGDMIPVYVNVGRARNDGSYHIYDLTQTIRDTAHRLNDVERPVGYALGNGISNDGIPQNLEIVNRGSIASKSPTV